MAKKSAPTKNSTPANEAGADAIHPKGAKKPTTRTPSLIRGQVTARRVGRPTKLTRSLIRRFMGYLEHGLHLDQCAALCGIAASMNRAWLRDGARDIEKGVSSLAAEFSAEVTQALARLQLRGVDTLAVYQRMAEGWDPRCAVCRRGDGPCGKHPQQLKLAADLARWLLQHRFPRQWAPGTVPAILAGDQDSAAPPAPAADGAPAPAAFGALVFLPARRGDDLE